MKLANVGFQLFYQSNPWPFSIHGMLRLFLRVCRANVVVICDFFSIKQNQPCKNCIDGVVRILSIHPGPFVIPQDTTAAMATALCDQQALNSRYVRSKKATGSDESYLLAIHDRNSNSLSGTVHTILDFQLTYGKVSVKKHRLRFKGGARD